MVILESLFPYDVDACVAKLQRVHYRLDTILTPWVPTAIPSNETPWSMRYIAPPDREIW